MLTSNGKIFAFVGYCLQILLGLLTLKHVFIVKCQVTVWTPLV